MRINRSCLFGIVAVVLVSVIAAPAVWAAPVTFESLLGEMTDLEELTTFPDPPYTCKQFSSYDRASTDPAVLTDANWFANGDRGRFLRTEERDGEKEYVLMDAAGPGAIVRIWSANPNDAGVVFVYLDGADEPALEMPLQAMLGGEAELFPSPIAGERSRGWNAHLPIPYAKHCKVTTSKGNFYYHINYRSYPAGTEVETFSTAKAQSALPKIQAVARALADPEHAVAIPGEGQRKVEIEVTLAPGESKLAAAVMGPGAIYEIRCQAEAEDVEAALRGCVLEIAFDGQAGIVAAPLGDFFGSTPGDEHPFASLPCGLLEDGIFYSHWVMPYKDGAEVKVVNHTEASVSLKGSLVTAGRPWTKDSLYFHAKWRAERDIPTRPRQDWVFMKAEGRGRFAGNMLHITNPVPQWWGEGDEKIYVDGEDFPSHFGTGSEDYYGYAWCNPALFVHAYHNQPRCDGPGNYGHTCVSRFHILDSIPFTTSFQFDMEVWHWAECEVSQSAVSYWYADTGAADDFPALAPALLTVPEVKRIPGVEGALEGEEMRVAACTGGKTQIQRGSYGWSRGAQLWWTEGKPGEKMGLEFDVEKAGRYEVLANFTVAKDYGIAQIAVNREDAGEPMDFYNPSVEVTGERSLGVFELRAGQNALWAEITGSNPKADPKQYMFGLDYLLLKPAP